MFIFFILKKISKELKKLKKFIWKKREKFCYTHISLSFYKNSTILIRQSCIKLAKNAA